MTLKDQFANGFNSILQRSGKQIAVTYYSATIGSVYDDDLILAISGNVLWTSGIVLPISSKTGTSDWLLVEQGKLQPHDQRLFVNGSLMLATGSLDVKIGLGSPTSDSYSIIPLGGISAEVEDTKVFKRVYIRRLNNGSLI